jgi:hypothetical protein
MGPIRYKWTRWHSTNHTDSAPGGLGHIVRGTGSCVRLTQVHDRERQQLQAHLERRLKGLNSNFEASRTMLPRVGQTSRDRWSIRRECGSGEPASQLSCPARRAIRSNRSVWRAQPRSVAAVRVEHFGAKGPFVASIVCARRRLLAERSRSETVVPGCHPFAARWIGHAKPRLPETVPSVD